MRLLCSVATSRRTLYGLWPLYQNPRPRQHASVPAGIRLQSCGARNPRVMNAAAGHVYTAGEGTRNGTTARARGRSPANACAAAARQCAGAAAHCLVAVASWAAPTVHGCAGHARRGGDCQRSPNLRQPGARRAAAGGPGALSRGNQRRGYGSQLHHRPDDRPDAEQPDSHPWGTRRHGVRADEHELCQYAGPGADGRCERSAAGQGESHPRAGVCVRPGVQSGRRAAAHAPHQRKPAARRCLAGAAGCADDAAVRAEGRRHHHPGHA